MMCLLLGGGRVKRGCFLVAWYLILAHNAMYVLVRFMILLFDYRCD